MKRLKDLKTILGIVPKKDVLTGKKHTIYASLTKLIKKIENKYNYTRR